ncbi:unnamed protein product [Mycena citricolor]|uniref:Uncharacterized protein n=1 Tax=Mycena citricolor TaxID=2018698 RepID=A0AAD2H8R3_9AGAR|nr:unnamed protein product [Mycena citricolor]
MSTRVTDLYRAFRPSGSRSSSGTVSDRCYIVHRYKKLGNCGRPQSFISFSSFTFIGRPSIYILKQTMFAKLIIAVALATGVVSGPLSVRSKAARDDSAGPSSSDSYNSSYSAPSTSYAPSYGSTSYSGSSSTDSSYSGSSYNGASYSGSSYGSVYSPPSYGQSGYDMSFDNWGGYKSMDGFDNFYGSKDFSHQYYTPTYAKYDDSSYTCSSQSVHIVQQRLAVLQEMAKQIISEQICDCETQIIVFQQYYASLGGYAHDITRRSGRHVGYDKQIVSHYGSMYDSDGSLSTSDFGFNGSDVGSCYWVPSGSNWNDNTSYSSVGSAYQVSQVATYY